MKSYRKEFCFEVPHGADLLISPLAIEDCLWERVIKAGLVLVNAKLITTGNVNHFINPKT